MPHYSVTLYCHNLCVLSNNICCHDKNIGNAEDRKGRSLLQHVVCGILWKAGCTVTVDVCQLNQETTARWRRVSQWTESL